MPYKIKTISLDDACRLISGSTAAAPVRAARRIRWRQLAHLPLRRSGWSAVVLFAASLIAPHDSAWSLLLLAASAIFAALAFDKWKRKKGRRRG